MLLDDFLYPILFVGGKGGVGKTTISAYLALKISQSGKKTLIISTDPAHSLGDVFDIKLSSTPKNIAPNLDGLELDNEKITKEHFASIESTLKSYSKPEMFGKIKEHLELSMQSPGASEAATLELICKFLTQKSEYEHIIFDTAPTGHTMRLLELPSLMSAWSNSLLSRQKEQDRFASSAAKFWEKKKDDKHNPFTPTKMQRWEKAMEKINERKELFSKANEVLKDKNKCAVFLVSIAQRLPLEETKRAVLSLKKFRIKCGGVVLNQIIPNEQKEEFWRAQVRKQSEILKEFEKVEAKKFFIKLSSKDLRGVKALEALEILN